MRQIFQGIRRMNTTNPGRQGSRCGVAAGALAVCAALVASPVLAQTATPDASPVATAPAPDSAAAAPPATPTAAPSEIMAVNLIRLLVKQGVITQAAADAIIQQAEDETRQAQLAAAPMAPAPPPSGVIRVPYVPQVVRNQIRDDIKKDVLAQAKSEGWAAPNAIPSWVDKFTWFGDIRFQDQSNFYSKSNFSPYIDYATFNNTGPIDINPGTSQNVIPFLDTQTDRLNQLVLRARFGGRFQVNDQVAMTVRLATGADDGPDSTTQLLGADSTKKTIWLDQAFLSLTPAKWASLQLGRAPDEFMHTDLVFSDNLNFDGAQATVSQPFIDQQLSVFGTAGIIPLGYVSSNFPNYTAPGNISDVAVGEPKTADHTQWLFALQGGTHFKPLNGSWSANGAVSFYDFDNVAGELSPPCDVSEGQKQCSTDSTRPAYMQKGNTLFFIRDILPNPASPNNFAQPQFVGLAYNYHVIDATWDAETTLFGDIQGQLAADYARNLAYDPAKILANPLIHLATNINGATYRSGPNAFLIKATLGTANPSNRGDWFLTAGYKYIEPDAVMDAFNDYDFHLGGTNAKGYFILGGYYFAKNSWADARWYSSNQVYNFPLAIDVLMLELNTRF